MSDTNKERLIEVGVVDEEGCIYWGEKGPGDWEPGTKIYRLSTPHPETPAPLRGAIPGGIGVYGDADHAAWLAGMLAGNYYVQEAAQMLRRWPLAAPMPQPEGKPWDMKTAHEKAPDLISQLDEESERITRYGGSGDALLNEAARVIEALTQPQPEPTSKGADGWKLVPIKPTEDMLFKMAEVDGHLRGDRDHPMLTKWEDYWNMALDASPAPPASQQREPQEAAELELLRDALRNLIETYGTDSPMWWQARAALSSSPVLEGGRPESSIHAGSGPIIESKVAASGKAELKAAYTQGYNDAATEFAPKEAAEVTEFNVGRYCLSEDDCIAEGLHFGAYERGVEDAAKAFGRNRRG